MTKLHVHKQWGDPEVGVCELLQLDIKGSCNHFTPYLKSGNNFSEQQYFEDDLVHAFKSWPSKSTESPMVRRRRTDWGGLDAGLGEFINFSCKGRQAINRAVEVGKIVVTQQ